MAVVALEPSCARHAGFDAGAVGTASGAPRGPATHGQATCGRGGEMRPPAARAHAHGASCGTRTERRNHPNVHAPVKSNHDAVRPFTDQYLAMKTRR